MPSAIDPSKFPASDVYPDLIDIYAGSLSTEAGKVQTLGTGIVTTWQGLSAVYTAPESPTVLDLMTPVGPDATTVGDNLVTVSGALTTFAESARQIKAALALIQADAEDFRARIAGGVDVQEVNPAWSSTHAGYLGADTPAYAAPSVGGTQATVSQYRTVTKEWHEVQSYVDENNALLAKVNAQQVLLWDAERTCANTVRALYGGAPLHSYQSENDPLGYGLDDIPEGVEMPWGSTVERTEGCGEQAVRFVFEDFLWNGVIVGGIWGTITGLGSLVLGYNPADGSFFSGEAYGAAWGNLGLLVAAVAIRSNPVTATVLAIDDTVQALGGDSILPPGVSDFVDKTDDALLHTGQALIAWDKWQDDPGTALGETVFNVATILIPAGAAVAGVKSASVAASVLGRMARVVDLVDPGAWVVNGATKLTGLTLGGIDNMLGRVGSSGSRVTVYSAADAASALKGLDDLKIDLNTVTVRVDGDVPVFEAPGVRVEMPPGSFEQALRDAGAHPADGASAVETVPVREPELVTAGGVQGQSGPGVVDTIVDDAPVRTETAGGSGGGEPTAVRDPDTTTGGSGGSGDGPGTTDAPRIGSGDGPGSSADGPGATGDGPGSSGDGPGGTADDVGDTGNGSGAGGDDAPTGSTADDGAGPTPVDGVRGNPIDPHYGEPRADHGRLDDAYTPPPVESLSPEVRPLVTDPDAPYGRGADGDPYTRAEWEERYIGPDDRPIYPGDDGAALGTRVEYTDMASFIEDHGGTLDRFGGGTGEFLSPEGVPFEARSLPPGSVASEYHVFHLAGELPPGLRIEVSDVSPAFGREGGGIQIRVFDGDQVLSVDDLGRRGFFVDAPPVAGADLNGFATPVPGSSSVSALHSASFSPEVQQSIIRHEYPNLLGVNSSRYAAGTPFGVNCTRCVVAVDSAFDGTASSAMPLRGVEEAPISDIPAALGVTDVFRPMTGYDSVVEIMQSLPDGSRGVVYVGRPTGTGHVFNVVRTGDAIVFLDGQTGRFATLEPFARLQLLITHRGVGTP